MYRYMPPKSSIWGHSLRNMAPARARERFGEFLRLAVAEHEFLPGGLMITRNLLGAQDSSQSILERFERVLGFKHMNGFFGSLTRVQFEQCFNELLADESLLGGKATAARKG